MFQKYENDSLGLDIDTEAFHDHLNVCLRCRTRPFDLCCDGLLLFASVVNSIYASKNRLPVGLGGGHCVNR